MATTTITGTINGVNNTALANKWITFRLVQLGTDSVATATVAQSVDSVQTDANGDFSIGVWNNGDSGKTSVLEITIDGSKAESVIIPTATATIELWDLIENYQADGSTSEQVPLVSSLFVRKSNNLSDLGSATTSRTNLGVAIGSNVQAHSAVLDATTASFTVAEESKLSGIEALAEVNDPTTVLDADIGSTVQAHSAILDATTASFTTADEAKLDGITGDATAITISAKVNEVGGITAGQVVYISGATGGSPQVSLADNSVFATADIIAVASEAGTNGQTIQVVTSGLLTGIDTSAFTEGQILYLGTAGALTATHPTGIDAVQRIGHAVKINASTGSILIEMDQLTVINDHNGIMRYQIVNQNAGTSASSAFTMVNDADHRASLSMIGSGYTAVAGLAESMVIYNEGYNKTVNAVDGNFGFEWWTDTTDAHNLSSTSKMSLTAEGELETQSQKLTHTAAGPDDHALEIIANAAGFGDVKALDIDYATGAIAAGQDEAIILVNLDESLATGGNVVGLEVLATEGSASVYGMLVGVGVNPVEQLSGTFSNMDSALVNATNRLTEFTTPGNDIQMFVADNDTITIGDAAKFQEIEFLLAIVASGSGVAPTFEFSTGVGTWTAFTPVDGTNGMRNNGVIAWLEADIPTWAVGTGSEYLIRITRTKNSLTTPPTESKVQIAATIEYTWNKDGDIAVRNIATTGTVDGRDISVDGVNLDANTAAIALNTAALSEYSPIAIITDSTTARSLSLTDIGAYIRLTNASSCTITVPANATVDWAGETGPPTIYVRVAATGIPTLSNAGVTINDTLGVIAALEVGSTFALQWVASNVWDII